MADFNTDIDELLAKSFAGELLPEEAEVLERWLSEDASHQAYAGEMQRIWQASGDWQATLPGPSFDTEKALASVKHQIHDQRRGNGGWTIWRNRIWLAAAASVALLAAALYFWPPITSSTQAIIAAERPLQDTLSDGTLITLNRGSGLSVQRGFNRGERRLSLQGEAYFKVQPDSSQTFTVEVRELEISVLGTAFNVDNLTDTAVVTVTVTEGRVRLTSPQQSVVIGAGEAATYHNADGSITKITRDPNFLSYQNRTFVFEGTPLRSVLRRLEAVYGVAIEVENQGQLDCLLTARFSDLELDRVLDIIADSFSFGLEQKNNGFLLTGAACALE